VRTSGGHWEKRDLLAEATSSFSSSSKSVGAAQSNDLLVTKSHAIEHLRRGGSTEERQRSRERERERQRERAPHGGELGGIVSKDRQQQEDCQRSYSSLLS
jgi:hypothetical protein